ncbi:peptide chain release factor 2 [Parvimonas sp. KA00067]|uniref:peptide chain release factor 2 n=1 Tax=Parvimonas sp. KA00067 TaxID=1588755 RepID=UPI0018D230FC|nr:peptide chain release factor 2 [Parvimonas sp. KA00067]
MENLSTVIERLKKLQQNLSEIGDSLDISKLEETYRDLEAQTLKEDFWNDSKSAKSILDKMKSLKFKIETFTCLSKKISDSIEFLEILSDEEFMEYEKEVLKNIKNIEKEYFALKLDTLMVGEYDSNNAILEIHAGAGGTDAQDWTEMLQRLYTRWISNKGFSFSILDYNSDTEGGIKSVTLKVDGENAYGFLKGEKGVHRLVRISPYDSSNKRHTSFASVDVFPEIEEITDVEINPKDLRIDTFRSGGAGGQHVNKTDSAVRITHIPTGLTVSCQSERSQMFNKDTAMRQLVAKLLIIKQEENREKIEDIQGKYSQIAWGSQIRSYVFQPYTLVKDHRTGYETGNVESVINGNIDEFINQYLCELIKKSR